MRPLPLEAAPSSPPGVMGLTVMRGVPAAVVDLGAVLGQPDGPRSRWVSVTAGGRVAALAVGSVDGLAHLDADHFGGLPPLLSGQCDAATAIGLLDRELCLLLEASRLVPDP